MIAIALVAALGAPAGGAATPAGCEHPPREEIRFGHSFRMDETTYLYLPEADGTGADKIGFWEETNEIEGLQTEDCRLNADFRIYRGDTFGGPAVP